MAPLRRSTRQRKQPDIYTDATYSTPKRATRRKTTKGKTPGIAKTSIERPATGRPSLAAGKATDEATRSKSKTRLRAPVMRAPNASERSRSVSRGRRSTRSRSASEARSARKDFVSPGRGVNWGTPSPGRVARRERHTTPISPKTVVKRRSRSASARS